jgi:Flp pilus assembly protein TadD
MADRIRMDRVGQAHENLAIALVESGHGAEAVPELEALLVREPNDAELHAKLAALLASLGRMAEAIRHLETALAIAERTGDAAVLPDLRNRLAACRDAAGGRAQ